MVHRNFEANLRDMVGAGVNSAAKVILNTIPVNLKDSPPFTLLTNSNLPSANRQRFEQMLAGAKSLRSQSNFLAAAGLFS